MRYTSWFKDFWLDAEATSRVYAFKLMRNNIGMDKKIKLKCIPCFVTGTYKTIRYDRANC